MDFDTICQEDFGTICQESDTSIMWRIPNKIEEQPFAYYSPSFSLNSREWFLKFTNASEDEESVSGVRFNILAIMDANDAPFTATYKLFFMDLNLFSKKLTEGFKYIKNASSPFYLKRSHIFRIVNMKTKQPGFISVRLTIDLGESQHPPTVEGKQSTDTMISIQAVKTSQSCINSSPPQTSNASDKATRAARRIGKKQRKLKQLCSAYIQAFNPTEDLLEDISKQVPAISTDISYLDDLRKLSEDMENMLLSGYDCDVTLKVKETIFRAHRVVLKARSSVFFNMFQHNMVENCSGTVDINDCNPEGFHDFLLYLYTGSLKNLTRNNVADLYYIADKYSVQGITAACVKFMQNNLSVDTFCDFFRLAIRHSELALLEFANTFFSKHLKDIIVTTQWKDFINDHPVEVNELFVKNLAM